MPAIQHSAPGGGGGSDDYEPFDANGDANAARPDVPASTTVAWFNSPSEPTHLGEFDIWEAAFGAYTPGGTDVAVADGGTGASTASGARSNLGLAIGSDVAPGASQVIPVAPKTANFTFTAGMLAPIDTTANTVTGTLPNAPAAGTICEAKWTAGAFTATIAAAGTDKFNIAGGVASFAMKGINANYTFIYFSGIWYVETAASFGLLDTLYSAFGAYTPGGPDVAVADGGTGASTAAAARSNLGVDGFGFPFTFNAALKSADTASGNVNRAVYLRSLYGGTISKIGLHVGTSSGNICVGTYANSGTGRLGVPAGRTSTSAPVACPATGYNEISLGGSVTINAGDWLALSVDNTTATFGALTANAATAALHNGFKYGENLGSVALPATATPIGLANAAYVLLGVA